MADQIEIPVPKMAFRPSPDLLMLVQQLEAGVRSGEITSLATVAIGPTGNMSWPGVGVQIAEMLIGAELMRDDMKAAIRGNRSRILRAS